MKDVARQLGATSTDANSFAEDMFYFERRIAEATPPSEELEDLRNRKIFTINALKSLAPSVILCIFYIYEIFFFFEGGKNIKNR